MPARSILLSVMFAAFPLVAKGIELVPHRAVYDLSLVSQTPALTGATGRIVMQLRQEKCDSYDLTYRFVARFEEEHGAVLTDQQTVTSESVEGDRFEFSTRTFVDGSPEKEIKGEAKSNKTSTRVDFEEPQSRALRLPVSMFPSEYTRKLIENAQAGKSIVETKIFDGSDDAGKLLTVTAIIGQAREPASRVEMDESQAESPNTAVVAPKGVRAWQIHESYYNSDSFPDGLPVFRTSYVLYENGISDDLMLDYGAYAFKGDLTELEILDAPECD